MIHVLILSPDETQSDVPIPSAQPSPPRPSVKSPPDCANPRTTPPPKCDLEDRSNIDDDDVDVFNTSQELPVEGDDQRRLVQFREWWIEISWWIESRILKNQPFAPT